MNPEDPIDLDSLFQGCDFSKKINDAETSQDTPVDFRSAFVRPVYKILAPMSPEFSLLKALKTNKSQP